MKIQLFSIRVRPRLTLGLLIGSIFVTNAYAEEHPALTPADQAYSAEDYPKAARLYRQEAEMGKVSAQINLALMYQDGQGVQQDYKQAAHWFNKAAQQGDHEAQYNLGLLYQDGKGVATDLVEADKWFLLAGSPKLVLALEKTMTTEQIAEARKRAGEFKAGANP